MARLKKLLPLVASAVLIAWVVWRVSPGELGRALATLNWPLLLPWTAFLLLAAYFWDAVSLLVLFRDSQRPLSYVAVLRARGQSYVFSVVNFGLGQGRLAWLIARAQDQSLLVTVARCLMLIYVDLYVLLTLALGGALLSDHPNAPAIALFCIVGLLGLIGVTLFVFSLPEAMVERLRQSRWGAWLPARSWSWSRFARLAVLRTGYFVIDMAYVVGGLWLVGVPIAVMLTLSVVPIVALIDGLPISVAGLGTREATLLLLLDPEQPAMVLAFCLCWTGCTILGRGLIGMVNLWLPP